MSEANLFVGLPIKELPLHQLENYDMDRHEKWSLYFGYWLRNSRFYPRVLALSDGDTEFAGIHVVITRDSLFSTWPTQLIIQIVNARDDFKHFFDVEPRIYLFNDVYPMEF